MADLETFVANAAETTCDGALAPAATTVVVVSTSAFSAVPFYATIDPAVDAKREVVRVTAKTATTLTVVRGQDGTSDVAHDSGAVVAQVPVGALWTDINDRVDAAVTSIAAKADDSAVVHLAGAETITGAKTFSTDPTLADGSSALSLTEGNAAYVALTGNQTVAGVKTFSSDPILADGSSALSLTEGDAAYAPLGHGGHDIVLTVGDLETTRAGAARGNPNVTWVYWLLDASTRESVGAAVVIPTGWSTVDVDVWWVNAGAGSGDVSFTIRTDTQVDGGTLGTGTDNLLTVTATTQDIVKKSTVVSGLAVTADSLTSFVCERLAHLAGDTLTNDIGVLSVVIRKAS